MRKKLLFGVLLCAAVAASVLAAPRPGGMGTIGGQVLNSAGKPVAGAHVLVQTTDGHHIESATTNAQGRFWVADLAEGQYSVRAFFEGHVSEWREGVWVAPGEQTNVLLHLSAQKAPPTMTR
ncbi:MAG TPA: carboxypeptidase-like regulatory domain-containing protein [Verrucomicrobiae bacterium]|nr:carboxypeptidase-like regulatory domain-containing protein [Verrucomicrobiae bacterium]